MTTEPRPKNPKQLERFIARPGDVVVKKQRRAAQVGAVDGQPTTARTRQLVARLNRARSTTGTRLLSAAQHAYENALRHAGVKMGTRARSRLQSSPKRQQDVLDAIEHGKPLAPLMPVVGIKESEVIAGAFDSFERLARDELLAWQARTREMIVRARYDPDQYGPRTGDVGGAVQFMVAHLIAAVRQALLEGTVAPSMLAQVEKLTGDRRVYLSREAKVPGRIPARAVLDAMKVAEGRAQAVLAESPDLPPTVRDVPGQKRTEEDIASSAGTVVYTWMHGFYGEPAKEFGPHADLDGEPTTDPDGDPKFFNNEDWPEYSRFFPDDHDGCTCEWDIDIQPE